MKLVMFAAAVMLSACTWGNEADARHAEVQKQNDYWNSPEGRAEHRKQLEKEMQTFKMDTNELRKLP